MKHRVLLVDGDIVSFIASARSETKIDWGDGDATRSSNNDQAIAEVDRFLTETKELLDADNVIVAMSDPRRRYFRHDIFPAYKAKRTHGQTPLALGAVKDHLRSLDEAVGYDNLEADDVLGILATTPNEFEKIIVTSDKDLRQIPGLHYDPRKSKEGIVEVVEGEARRFFWQQTLSGDATDGVPGCPGIGPARASKVLDKAAKDWHSNPDTQGSVIADKFLWGRVVETYAKKGKDEAYAVTQARCVRVLRYGDYEPVSKEVTLWTPSAP